MSTAKIEVSYLVRRVAPSPFRPLAPSSYLLLVVPLSLPRAHCYNAPLIPTNPMEFMLPLKHVTEQDKRALTLYFAIALLSAACVILVMLYQADFHVGKKADAEQAPTPTATPIPKPTPTSRNR